MAKFTFNNTGGGSAYFTLELRRRPTDGFYPTSSLQSTFITGSKSELFSALTGSNLDGVVQTPNPPAYKWSVVVPSGTPSLIFNPTSNIPASGSVLRGTGIFNLTLDDTANGGSSQTFTAAQMTGPGIINPQAILAGGGAAPPSAEIELLTEAGAFILTQGGDNLIAEQT
jgi:hypothetical protein